MASALEDVPPRQLAEATANLAGVLADLERQAQLILDVRGDGGRSR